jgi:hypothetical protein
MVSSPPTKIADADPRALAPRRYIASNRRAD